MINKTVNFPHVSVGNSYKKDSYHVLDITILFKKPKKTEIKYFINHWQTLLLFLHAVNKHVALANGPVSEG